MASHHHRSGPLKQQNKKHKTGKHESKSLISKKSGGKVDRKAGLPLKSASGATASALAVKNKQQRVQQQKLQRQKQKEELWMKKRIGAGSQQGPPKIVALVALSDDADLPAIKQNILQGASGLEEPKQDLLPNVVVAAFAQHKQKICVVECGNDLLLTLDAAKVADLVVFVLPVHNGQDFAVNTVGQQIISCLRAQGMPSLVGVVQGLEALAPKAQNDLKKFGTRFFQSEFGDQVKVTVPNAQQQITRAILAMNPKTIHWRESRSYLLASGAKLVPVSNPKTTTNVCDLHVTGYLRGKPLSVNQLMHITDVGTFQMEFIAKAQVTQSSVVKAANDTTTATEQDQDQEVEILVRANPSLQQDLKYEAEVDPFASEQTWPTKEELEQAELEAKRNSKTVAGMSSYQAAWMTDEAAGQPARDIAMDDDTHEADHEEDHEPSEPVPQDFCKTGCSTKSDMDDDEDGDDISMADEDDLATREKELAKRKQEKENMEFPDEVDVPPDSLAKIRFARYRGLKSMRTSVWDPKESLPMDYARLFQFDDFVNVQRRVLSEAKQVEEDLRTQMTHILRKQSIASKPRSSTLGSAMDQDDAAMEVVDDETTSNEAKLSEGYVASGIFVTICIKNVPVDKLRNRLEQVVGTPLIMGALLRHENRLSVLNFSIQRANSGDATTLKSKDTLQFHCGFRRFDGRPVFSDQSLKSDKHQFHRFLPQSGWCVASVYGPATFQPASVMLFRSTGSHQQELVASGTLLNVDPDRIVLKRVIVTGTPVKVKKRKAVVRYMFHTPEDVRWFKPIELVTKHGMTGHIKESLGTHGDFKAVFNKPVKQHDTVCLHLYKRVYPKFLPSQ